MSEVFSKPNGLIQSLTSRQLEPRKRQLIKNTIQMVAAMTGVYVTRLNVAEIIRIQSDRTHNNDPMKIALDELPTIFKACYNKGIDIAASVKGLIEMYKADKKVNAVVFLAWKITKKKKPRVSDNPRVSGRRNLLQFCRIEAYFHTEKKPQR